MLQLLTRKFWALVEDRVAYMPAKLTLALVYGMGVSMKWNTVAIYAEQNLSHLQWYNDLRCILDPNIDSVFKTIIDA